MKKRRLVNGEAHVFKRPGEESGSEDEGDGEDVGPIPTTGTANSAHPEQPVAPIADVTQRITIIEDD